MKATLQNKNKNKYTISTVPSYTPFVIAAEDEVSVYIKSYLRDRIYCITNDQVLLVDYFNATDPVYLVTITEMKVMFI